MPDDATASSDRKARANQLLRQADTLIRLASEAAAFDKMELAKQRISEIRALLKDQSFPSELGIQINRLCRTILKDANDTKTKNQVMEAFARLIAEGA